jgi:peptide deformylase
MREAMTSADGVGLAANQIGLSDKVCVVRFQGNFYDLFNPEIIKFSDNILFEKESCLSVPNMSIEIPRSETIIVVFRNHNDRKVKMKASGMLARIFHHEIDHLNGILISDKRSTK